MGRPRRNAAVSIKESTQKAPTVEELPAASESPSSSPPVVENKKRSRAPSESSGNGKVSQAKKRGKKSMAVVEEEVKAKRIKLESIGITRGHGHVLTLGQGDTGQLGLGEDVMEKSRPGLVKEVENAVEVVAGGMHTVVLDNKGDVWTFGCNDEGSLGRVVGEEEECFIPGKVCPLLCIEISFM